MELWATVAVAGAAVWWARLQKGLQMEQKKFYTFISFPARAAIVRQGRQVVAEAKFDHLGEIVEWVLPTRDPGVENMMRQDIQAEMNLRYLVW